MTWRPVPVPRPSTSRAWDVVQRARAARRPSSAAYLATSFRRFTELHGDRRYRDDPAIRGGIAWLGDHAVIVIGLERGCSPEEQLKHNFGMAFPEGYYKAIRLMRLGEHFGLPTITLVDTPGAYPGLGAEERGQAGAIAETLRCIASLRVPTISVIIGQGGSGGALALALADRVLMLEHAMYSVISPEGCASILWHRSDRAEEAAVALRLTAQELQALGLIDEVILESPDRSARGIPEAPRLTRALVRHLRELAAVDPDERLRRRLAKYAAMGRFAEAAPAPPPRPGAVSWPNGGCHARG